MNDNLERFTKVLKELDLTKAIGPETAATLILAVVMKEGFAKVVEELKNVQLAITCAGPVRE